MYKRQTVPTDCPNLKVDFPVDNGNVYITTLRFDDYNLMYCAITKHPRRWNEWSCSDDPLNPNPNENVRCQNVRNGIFAWAGTYQISSCLSQCIPNECTCANGIAATGTECPTHGDAKCTSCDDEYRLHSGAVCKEMAKSCYEHMQRGMYILFSRKFSE